MSAVKRTVISNFTQVAVVCLYVTHDDICRGLQSICKRAAERLNLNWLGIYNDFLDPSEDEKTLYLVTALAGVHRGGRLPKYYVVWQQEQALSHWLDPTDPQGSIYCRRLEKALAIWESKKTNMQMLTSRFGSERVFFLPITSTFYHSNLCGANANNDGLIPFHERQYDILFLGAPNKRRAAVLKLLADNGMRVKHCHKLSANEYRPFLRNSKILLNVHFMFASQSCCSEADLEVVRLRLGLSNGIFVISERSNDADLDEIYERIGVKFCDTEQILHACSNLLLKSQKDCYSVQKQLQEQKERYESAFPIPPTAEMQRLLISSTALKTLG